MLSGLVMAAGAVFIALASVGVLRMPDLYTRMQAASKAATIGVALLAMGAALQFGSLEAGVRAALVSLFLLMTAPIASHLMARAAYAFGVRMDREALTDELAARVHEKDAGPRTRPNGETKAAAGT